MDKMKMESGNLTEQNIDKIAALFPNCITEAADGRGGIKKAVNFDLLRQMLSEDVVEGDEAYEFTWVGKKASIVEANKPIRKTLRPCPEESVDWDHTENLYIEGDNLEVLKLLQESYLGKVKMIYIDPPYNTGNDFIYRDDFAQSVEEYAEEAGVYDEEENRLFKNTDSNGRFHSDWCSMMYSRLMLARNLLSDAGAIFISIDDNEVHNTRYLGDEVFGIENFLGVFQWHRRQNPDSRNINRISMDNEYIVTYAKKKDKAVLKGIQIDVEKYKNPDNDPRGPWASIDLSGLANAIQRPNLHYNITDPSTGVMYPPNPRRGWSKSKENVDRMINEGRILFPKDPSGRPREKKFLYELRSNVTGVSTWLDSEKVGYTTNGTREVSALFSGKWFDFPKPIALIHFFIEQCTDENDVILDFFSGSATTAHAVMQLNAEDGGHRKFIMVQLPEPCDEKSEAYKAGYKNICEIGKERIRRAGAKIKAESPLTTQDLDTGFRVFKLDDTNMKDVYYAAGDYDQWMLSRMESNIKEDRTDLDLLFGCLLEWGLPLSLPYTSEEIDGCTVHTYNEGDLIACFDEDIPDSVVKTIARRRPLRAVFRDASFADSPSKINVGEIFKLLAPDTRVKVI